MGFALSWFAVKGAEKTSVLSRLGLSESTEADSVPDADIVGAQLHGGWYLILANQCDYVARLPLSDLSASAVLVTCAVEEHVMYSVASQWADGRRLWQVTHDSARGLTDLLAEGVPPDPFSALRTEALAQLEAEGGADSAVDFVFDVPVDLAKASTGFRHDQNPPSDDEACFITLLRPPKRSFLASLFHRQ